MDCKGTGIWDDINENLEPVACVTHSSSFAFDV